MRSRGTSILLVVFSGLLGGCAESHLVGGHGDQGVTVLDGEPPPQVQALGQRMRPSLVDLFVALTRKPELDRTHF